MIRAIELETTPTPLPTCGKCCEDTDRVDQLQDVEIDQKDNSTFYTQLCSDCLAILAEDGQLKDVWGSWDHYSEQDKKHTIRVSGEVQTQLIREWVGAADPATNLQREARENNDPSFSYKEAKQ